MKLQDLISDSGTVGESADVEEISCGLNDVANFKNLGIPVKSVIEVSRPLDPHSVPSQYSRVGGELVV